MIWRWNLSYEKFLKVSKMVRYGNKLNIMLKVVGFCEVIIIVVYVLFGGCYGEELYYWGIFRL